MPTSPAVPLPSRRALASACALACAFALAGCTEDGLEDGSQSGSGAGDAGDLLLFTGVYDLTGPWRGGGADDAAYLVVGEPDGAEAEVRLYEVDAGLGGCFEPLPGGVARIDDFTGDVFLDDLPDFEEGRLSLQGDGSLAIDHVDAFDADRDGDRSERIVYVARRFDALAEVDFPLCP